jgi:hypothetical protein
VVGGKRPSQWLLCTDPVTASADVVTT